MSSENMKLKVFLTVGILGVLVLIFIGIYKTTGLQIENDMLIIKGVYGVKIQISGIEEIIKIDSLPAGGKRKNGLGLGSIKIGHFYYYEVGDVRLYILEPDTPYLLIKSKTEKIIVGLGKNENEALYAKLKNKL